jgi:hypothetical protein
MKTLQTDIFAAGEARSIPPHYDPAIVEAVLTRETVDRDHVGPNTVGRYGNNALIIVLEVMNKAAEVIYSETFGGDKRRELATSRANYIGRMVDANRQGDLFA